MTDSALVAAPAATLSSGQILSGLRTVANVLAPDLSADELKLFAMVAARSGLDPFAKQIYAVKRQGRVTFQTGIDGYRSIAARTGLYDGQDEPEYGPDCACGDGRPAGHPEYATVRVYRKGVSRAIAATAYWHEYKPEQGQSGKQDAMWVRMPRVMIAKVAEALALRKAFPYDPENRQGIGADVYTADEMAQADRGQAPAAPQPSARERVAQRAAALTEPAPEPEPAPAETDAAEVEGTFVEAPDPEPPVAAGLTREALKDLCVKGGKSSAAISKVLGCLVDQVAARVNAMTDAERGVLADELGLTWRQS
jgi:phage recombination protein Bet